MLAATGACRETHANLDEYTNDYGVTAVCTVNDHHARSDQPEMGANLWVRAPSNDCTDERWCVVTAETSDRYVDDSVEHRRRSPMGWGWQH